MHDIDPPQTTLSGPASVPPTTVPEVFKRVVRKYPTKPALRVKRNGEWVQWTYREYYMDVAKAAKSLIRLGLEPHHGVCILGFNSPEWFIGYMSAIMVRVCGLCACCVWIHGFCGVWSACAELRRMRVHVCEGV